MGHVHSSPAPQGTVLPVVTQAVSISEGSWIYWVGISQICEVQRSHILSSSQLPSPQELPFKPCLKVPSVPLCRFYCWRIMTWLSTSWIQMLWLNS